MRPLPNGVILPVAGVSWRQDKVSKVNEGDTVQLHHDVNNPHDPWACAVTTTSGELLGYVPAQAGLAARLTTLHPGGVWDGVIVEKTGRDTVGLRVKITGQNSQTRSLIVGADVSGVRHDPHEPGEGEPGDENASAEHRVAYSLTGRVLGDVVEVGTSYVRVAAGKNTVARYPRDVVHIR